MAWTQPHLKGLWPGPEGGVAWAQRPPMGKGAWPDPDAGRGAWPGAAGLGALTGADLLLVGAVNIVLTDERGEAGLRAANAAAQRSPTRPRPPGSPRPPPARTSKEASSSSTSVLLGLRGPAAAGRSPAGPGPPGGPGGGGGGGGPGGWFVNIPLSAAMTRRQQQLRAHRGPARTGLSRELWCMRSALCWGEGVTAPPLSPLQRPLAESAPFKAGFRSARARVRLGGSGQRAVQGFCRRGPWPELMPYPGTTRADSSESLFQLPVCGTPLAPDNPAHPQATSPGPAASRAAGSQEKAFASGYMGCQFLA